MTNDLVSSPAQDYSYGKPNLYEFFHDLIISAICENMNKN